MKETIEMTKINSRMDSTVTNNILDPIANNNEINQANEKVEINYNCTLKPTDYMAIESIRKIQNPFQMIGVETVMKDLNICKSVAYRLFQNEEFPAINIGKSNQVMILAYLIWKMNRRA